jgi:hypothetical protein
MESRNLLRVLLALSVFAVLTASRLFASPPGLPLLTKITCDAAKTDEQTEPETAQQTVQAGFLSKAVEGQLRDMRDQLEKAQEAFQHASQAFVQIACNPLSCFAEDDRLERRVFYIPDLVTPKPGSGGTVTTERELMNWITTSIRPETWLSAGGSGTIDYYALGGVLVVNQRRTVLDQIEKALNARRAKD